MLDFVHAYRRPDGSVPAIRDIDNGRLHIFGKLEPESHDQVLDVGHEFFALEDRGGVRRSEDALWLSVVERLQGDNSARSLSARGSRAFMQSGFFVMRNEFLFLLIVASPVGMKGYSGHTHNDFLSFDLFAYDRTFLVDSGSYVYGRSLAWRNKFRSIYSHNGIVIDGIEPNPIPIENPFEISNRTEISVNRWHSDRDYDLLDAEVKFQLESGELISHQRVIRMNKRESYWLVHDEVRGAGNHRIETLFHFAEGVGIALNDSGSIRTTSEQGANLVILPRVFDNIEASLESGWASTVYGKKSPNRIACYQYKGALPFQQDYILYPCRNISNIFCDEMNGSALAAIRKECWK
jgi:hypothetical protein